MTAYFVRHKTASNLLMILLLALGLMSIGKLRRETFPDFAKTEFKVTVIWPGATADEAEESICRRVEEAVDSITNVNEVRSEAREGVGSVTIEMVEKADSTNFLNDIQTEIDAIDSFPDDAEYPIIEQLGRTDGVVSIAVSGPMSATDLKEYCEQIKDRLQGIPEVSLVTTAGFSERQIQISLRQDILLQYNLSVSDIAEAIEMQSVDMPAGTLETRNRDAIVRVADARRSIREFEELVVIGGDTGAEIRLGQIADITDTFELDEDKILFNGERAGLLRVQKNKSEDTLKIFDAIKKFVKAEREAAPAGVHFNLTDDAASIVKDRLTLLVKNGWQGLILIFLALWLFFNWRFAMWVALGLPVSFMGAFFFFDPLNMTVNMITMVGLLMALGLLMDDSLVIAENIAKQSEQGNSAEDAAIKGMKQIKAGVISSFLTTIVVFGPLTMISGNIGKVLRVMPVVLILVLTVSMIEAFWILPHHLLHSVEGGKVGHENRFREWFNSWFARLTEVVAKLAAFCVRNRYGTIAFTIMCFLITISLMISGTIKFVAFPDLEGDIIEARILMPQGTPLEQTEGVVERMVAELQKINKSHTPNQPDQQSLVINIRVEYNKNTSSYESGPHVATIGVDLLSTEIRKTTIDEIISEWQQIIGDIPDALAISIQEPVIGPAGKALQFRLSGESLDAIKNASLELQQEMQRYTGVYNIQDDLRKGKLEYRISLREGAFGNSMTASSLARQLNAAFQGRNVDEIQVGSEAKEINVRIDSSNKDNFNDLYDFRILLPDGTQAPLGAVANIETGYAWSRIARINGRRTISVEADVDMRLANSSEVRGAIVRDFLPGFLERHPNVKYSLEGEATETAETQSSMLRAGMIGLIGIFLILSFQFNSFVEPIIVMSAIPMALIGVIIGHKLFGYDISMPSMMGFASLAGIVVNDSILLVEFLKMKRKEYPVIEQAAIAASRARFRAIFLTSVTTVFGLLPLVFEKSMQAQILIPLALSIVFGLMASTVLILIVIPSLYTIFGDFGLTEKIKK